MSGGARPASRTGCATTCCRRCSILAVVLACWQVAVKSLDIPPWLLPAPTDIIDRFFKTTTLWYHTSSRCWKRLPASWSRPCLGVSLSAGIVHSRFFERGVFPT